MARRRTFAAWLGLVAASISLWPIAVAIGGIGYAWFGPQVSEPIFLWAATLPNVAVPLGLGVTAFIAGIVAWRSAGRLQVASLVVAIALDAWWFWLSPGIVAFLFRPWSAF